ncbi:MAG: bifunctional DNA-formamidopyrimidine glycosylase/DNA-(apurinic or apyrimidinic site) lyase [Patescibacteria group bacterium]
MPELPEVQTTVKGLNSRVLSRTFIDVWSDWEKIVKKPKDFRLFKKDLKGKKITKIWRRAKNVIFELSAGHSLLIHMKMTGHLMVGKWILENKKWKPAQKGPLEEKINLYIHILFFLDNGLQIALSDLRKFAKIELWKTEELLKDLESLGPEPLDKNFSFVKFKERLKNKKGKVKVVIMDPAVIVGVGNIYSSEALWRAKIHPQKDVSKLTEKELKNLYNAIKKVLSLGIKLGGESFADYRKVDGTKGDFDDERRVYKREGEKCFRCKTPIKRLKFAGRSAFFCPRCQKP